MLKEIKIEGQDNENSEEKDKIILNFKGERQEITKIEALDIIFSLSMQLRMILNGSK